MQSDQITIIIQGKTFHLTSKLQQSMLYFQEWKALQTGKNNICIFKEDSVVTLSSWTKIVQILEHFDCQLPQVPKVTSNVAEDAVGSYLTKNFGDMRIGELNRLYVVAQYLKVQSIKRAIAGYLASKVYITSEINLSSKESQSKSQNKLLTSQQEQIYCNTYPFLN